MKINVILFAFILITFNVFKAAIIPNTAVTSIEATLIPITVNTTGLESAFANVSTCSGIVDCINAVVHAFVAVIYFIGQLLVVLFFIIADILLLIVLFFTIGFSPIPTAPAIVNLIVIGTFVVMTIVAVISFVPGE